MQRTICHFINSPGIIIFIQSCQLDLGARPTGHSSLLDLRARPTGVSSPLDLRARPTGVSSPLDLRARLTGSPLPVIWEHDPLGSPLPLIWEHDLLGLLSPWSGRTTHWGLLSPWSGSTTHWGLLSPWSESTTHWGSSPLAECHRDRLLWWWPSNYDTSRGRGESGIYLLCKCLKYDQWRSGDLLLPCTTLSILWGFCQEWGRGGWYKGPTWASLLGYPLHLVGIRLGYQ